jgi:multidrug efflux pump
MISTLSQRPARDGAPSPAPTYSQVDGVGEVVVSGSALPAVRVELNPDALYKYGIGLEDLRAALASANSHSPKGAIEVGDRHYQLYDNDQASTAVEYQPLIVAYRNGAAVRLTDVADVVDSVEDLRNAGLANGKPSVLVIIYRQPGANIVATVDRVIGLLPELHASISPAIDIMPAVDRSTTIRASLAEIERTLMLAVVLVVLVVRSGRATLVPTVAVPVSLIGTLGVMYLLGYSLDNLSLMALTVATGFVVDDAIVVLENISRHIEQGMSRMQAALQGAAEVSFTVLSMSVSLIAVFIPILLMGGIVGRLFREFAVTLSAAIMLSLVVSLATTPMMCALILRRPEREGSGRLMRWSERLFAGLQHAYDRSLTWALDHSAIVLAILVGTLCLNIYLYVIVPKGFFPQQDTGRIIGAIQADQAISFQLMQQKLQEFIAIIRKDPAVQTVVGFTGGGSAGGQTNGGFIFMSLKPSSERQTSADRVITQLRREVAQVPGASLFLQAVQDIRIGGRSGNAQYQYTLQDYDADELFAWSPRILAELQSIPQITQVNTDQQNKGLETDITIDRDTAARLGINVAQIDNTLYDAFGQREVSTVYNARNQYHVVMEAAPQYWQNAETLKDVFISTAGGTASGTQTTNAVAGTVFGPAAAAARTCTTVPASIASTTPSATPGTPTTPSLSFPAVSSSAPLVPSTTGAATTTATTSTSAAAPQISFAPSSTASSTTGTTSSTTSTNTPPASAPSTPVISTPTTTCAAASTSNSSNAAAAVAADAVRNQALNSIGNTGHGTASTGSAVSTTAETMIPLSAVTHIGAGNIPLAVNHQGLTVATTISFNLAPGAALSDAVQAVNEVMARLGVPPSIHGTFQGTARAFQESVVNEPYLILAALIAVYIVLGILYESFIHPLTILSTLPSAGVGAVLALMLFHIDFSIMSLIGVILLIGIVKKNAIMMIDFALHAERSRGLSSREAIYTASLLRFRPIMMTTAAALFGALPLAFGMGDGGELRQPLGIAIVGGLLVSQLLTLYTTPVIYLSLDGVSLWLRRMRGSGVAVPDTTLAPGE